MAKNRGLYGQDEGNGRRQADQVFTDRLTDNQIAEGDYMRKMFAAAGRRDFRGMEALRNDMRESYINQGVDPALAQERADSVLRQGMSRVKL